MLSADVEQPTEWQVQPLEKVENFGHFGRPPIDAKWAHLDLANDDGRGLLSLPVVGTGSLCSRFASAGCRRHSRATCPAVRLSSGSEGN